MIIVIMLSRLSCVSRMQSARSLVVQNHLSSPRVISKAHVSRTCFTPFTQNAIHTQTKSSRCGLSDNRLDPSVETIDGNAVKDKLSACRTKVEPSCTGTQRHMMGHPDAGTMLILTDFTLKPHVRHLSSNSIKNFILRLISRDKKLENIVKEVESQRQKAPVEAESKVQEVIVKPSQTPFSYLMQGCKSSQHLLDLISSYMDKDMLELRDYLRALEHLQTLVFSEIVKKWPTLTTNTIPVLGLCLKLDSNLEIALKPVTTNPVFVTMCHKLEEYIATMDSAETIACFSSLTWLGVPNETSIITKCYEKIPTLGHKNFSLIEISLLLGITNTIVRRDIYREVHVIPKLKYYLEQKQRIPNDKKYLVHLMFLLSLKDPMGIKQDTLLHAYKEMYRICKETNHLQDMYVTTYLLRFLHHSFILSKTNRKTVSESLLDEQPAFIQNMSDMAMKALEANVFKLTPLELRHISPVLKESLRNTEIKTLAEERCAALLLNKNLKVPEIIFVASIQWDDLPPDVRKIVQKELTAKRHHISHSCLLYLLRLWDHRTIADYRLESLINDRILHNIQSIFENIRSIKTVLEYLCRDTWKYYEKFDNAFQQQLNQGLEKMPYGLPKDFLRYSLLYLLQIPTEHLSASSVQTISRLTSIAVKPDISDGMLLSVLRNLNAEHFNPRKLPKTAREHKGVYKTATLNLLTNVTKVMHQRFQVIDGNRVQLFCKYMTLYFTMSVYDPLCLELTMEKLHQFTNDIKSEADFVSFCRLVTELRCYHEGVFNNLNKFVLDNMPTMSSGAWMVYAKLLDHTGHPLEVGGVIWKYMKTFFEERFDSQTPLRKIEILLMTNRLEMYLEEKMKSVFTVEFLSLVDSQIQDGLLHTLSTRRSMVKLNRDVCIDFPQLGIKWFQPHREVQMMEFNRNEAVKKAPADVSTAIEVMAGGSEFVGHWVDGSNGFCLWRVILLDENDNPVEYREDNFKYADELGLKRICFWYYGYDESKFYMTLNSRHFVGFEAHRIRQLEKCGYNCVLIFDTEWFSITMATLQDKVNFLRCKMIEKNRKQCLTPSRMENLNELVESENSQILRNLRQSNEMENEKYMSR